LNNKGHDNDGRERERERERREGEREQRSEMPTCGSRMTMSERPGLQK